jgi:hypothetical protein
LSNGDFHSSALTAHLILPLLLFLSRHFTLPSDMRVTSHRKNETEDEEGGGRRGAGGCGVGGERETGGGEKDRERERESERAYFLAGKDSVVEMRERERERV